MKSFVPNRKPRWLDERIAVPVRFVINGLVATAVHFSVLSFAIQVLHVPLAAAANFVAALIGITVSFLGNRYFVFRCHTETIITQATRFAGLYVAIACLHAAVMFLFTDWLGVDFRLGFLVATAMQVMVSYLGNRHLVFAK